MKKYLLIILSLFLSVNLYATEKSITDQKTTDLFNITQKFFLADTNVKSEALKYGSDQAVGISKSFLEKYFPTVEATLNLGDPSKPTGGLLVVAPLSNPSDIKNTYFTQLSAFHNDNRTTVNLGLGYRRLEWDNKLLLGINGFYDHEFPYDHGRTSIGLEARTTVGEVNFNNYWGVSGWRNGKNSLEERALGGRDIELGVPLPYMNWAKVYARGFMWDAVDGAKDLKGGDLSLRAQVPVLPGLAIEAGHRYYTNLNDESFLRITYNVTDMFAKKQTEPLFSNKAYQLASMENRRYDKVRRENLIVKQRKASFGIAGF